ncbi:SH3 domain-containing protein [Nocardioides pacificus]
MANSHKRDTVARRKPTAALVAAPIAVLATISAVSLGVLGNNPAPSDNVFRASSSLSDVTDREVVSRASGRGALLPADAAAVEEVRQDKAARKRARAAKAEAAARAAKAEAAATRKAVLQADTELWTTENLNLWDAPGEDARQLGVVDAGEKVLVTGRAESGREEIVIKRTAFWVTAGYLSDEEPVEGIGGECTNGTAVASGVSPNVSAVHQAVCAAFPEITTYGTFRSDGEHSQGLAVDIMVSGDRGWEVAEFVRANYAELGVSYLIYAQKIWSVERAGEGWRSMSDRGSSTANHYDHVHVTTY